MQVHKDRIKGDWEEEERGEEVWVCVLCMKLPLGNKESVMASGEIHVDSLIIVVFAGMSVKMGR